MYQLSQIGVVQGPAITSSSQQFLTEEAQRRLRSSPYLPLREIEVDAVGGYIFLRGRVPTNYLRREASSIVDQVTSRKINVVNRIDVVDLSVWQPPPAAALSDSRVK